MFAQGSNKAKKKAYYNRQCRECGKLFNILKPVEKERCPACKGREIKEVLHNEK